MLHQIKYGHDVFCDAEWWMRCIQLRMTAYVKIKTSIKNI